MINWITTNWGTILAIIPMVIGIATVIAKITPNKTDDKVVGILMKVVDLLAIHAKPTEIGVSNEPIVPK